MSESEITSMLHQFIYTIHRLEHGHHLIIHPMLLANLYMHILKIYTSLCLHKLMHYYSCILHMSVLLHPLLLMSKPPFYMSAAYNRHTLSWLPITASGLSLFKGCSILGNSMDFHHRSCHLQFSYCSIIIWILYISGHGSKILHKPWLSGCSLIHLGYPVASKHYHSGGGNKCLEACLVIQRDGRLYAKCCPPSSSFFIVCFVMSQSHFLYLDQYFWIIQLSIDTRYIPMVRKVFVCYCSCMIPSLWGLELTHPPWPGPITFGLLLSLLCVMFMFLSLSDPPIQAYWGYLPLQCLAVFPNCWFYHFLCHYYAMIIALSHRCIMLHVHMHVWANRHAMVVIWVSAPEGDWYLCSGL